MPHDERDGRRTILVVDDDDGIREITALALETVGDFTVVTAAGGQEALDKAREHVPDAVLLDVMMPGMDGPTVFRHLLADPDLRHIPVILLTAKVRVGGAQVWDDLPVAGVIPKPFDPMSLGSEVRSLLSW